MKTQLNELTAVLTVLSLLILIIASYYKKSKKIENTVPYDVFKDLMNNKCNNDCQNCVCKKTTL